VFDLASPTAKTPVPARARAPLRTPDLLALL
jgi:hypothetical protein